MNDQAEIIFAVVTNSDLTEGRGRPVTIGLAYNKFTAQRMAEKKGVMGSNAEVRPLRLLINDGKKYINIDSLSVEWPSEKDKELQNKELERIAIIERAKTLGLTDDDIAKLKAI